MKESTPDRSTGQARILPLRGGDRVVLRDLVEEVVRAAADRVGDPDVPVSVDVPATVSVEADGRVLSRILTSLLVRAVDGARRGGGPCRPEVLLTGVLCHDGVEIEVASSGASVDPAVRAVFGRCLGVPAESRCRTGAWASDLVREAALVGGTLSALDCPEGGAAVTLRLPLRQAALRRAA